MVVIYNAPDGEAVDTLGTGYNFVTVLEDHDSWLRIGEERWIRSEKALEPYAPSRFAGVELPEEPLPYTMAWTLRHLRGAATPGGEESPNNRFIYRYSRVNIYATVEVNGYNWYQIGSQ